MKNSARHGFRPGRFSSARLTQDAVTPKGVYLRRREFLIGAGAFAMGGAPALAEPLKAAPSAWKVDEKLTPQEAVTTYNNFYEFGTDKSDPSANSGSYKPLPWTLEIGGMVQKPKTFDMGALIEKMPLEERIYRMRCVEAWSMVIPWIGFPLASLLAQVEPLGSAKYVAFTGLKRPEEMPGQTGLFQVLDWPYVEGLRLDEAMHPLTILAVGVYGETLPKANGAPIRLVVPWKYGFKGIKAITKIEFVEKQPPTSWNLQAANEYGFYANVNPAVDHPRWSQASERRIGEDGFFGSSRRPTLPFNGYGEEVASLYAGMDLKVHY